MILKALADYYHRLIHDQSISVPPYGFEDKPIPFLIVLNKDGCFLNIRDNRLEEEKEKTVRKFRVPLGAKKTSGIKENLLWDNPQYILGEPRSNKSKDVKKAKNACSAFKKRIKEEFEDIDDDGIGAIIHFYETEEVFSVRTHSLFQEIMKENGNISFILDGDVGLIAQRPKVVERIKSSFEAIGKPHVSAISGELDDIAILHTAIKGVWGSQTTGANIVSFNGEAYCSFGRTKKDQGLNAPIGKHNEFAYTTALNLLLRKNSNQRMQVGDASTVFWASSACELETDLPDYLAPPKKGEESVSYGKIRSLLAAVKTGIPPEEGDIPFFVLGLAPNASRIAVRFWYDGNVKEIKERIAEHFEDLAIVHSPAAPEFLSLFQLMVSTAADRKADNIPPNIGGDFARAVFSGGTYPRTLFANAIRRCKAEQQINYERAAVVKGFLARLARIKAITNKEVSMALDKDYDNIGYVLGRLFAVLERIQEQAQGRGLNKTIRDTYFGAATSSPLVTFKRLQSLAIHHMAKIRNSGKNTTWLEQLMQEISGHIPAQGIPSILNLEDQGRFSIGYYHQRQDFFVKNEDKIKGDDE